MGLFRPTSSNTDLPLANSLVTLSSTRCVLRCPHIGRPDNCSSLLRVIQLLLSPIVFSKPGQSLTAKHIINMPTSIYTKACRYHGYQPGLPSHFLTSPPFTSTVNDISQGCASFPAVLYWFPTCEVPASREILPGATRFVYKESEISGVRHRGLPLARCCLSHILTYPGALGLCSNDLYQALGKAVDSMAGLTYRCGCVRGFNDVLANYSSS